jgi:hypothetical protein
VIVQAHGRYIVVRAAHDHEAQQGAPEVT